MEYQALKAEDLSNFGDASLDALSACYVYRLVPDRVEALRETCRVLKLGAMGYIAVWKLARNIAGLQVMRELTGESGDHGSLAMACSAEGSMEGLVAQVPGFELESVKEVCYEFDLGRDPDAAFKKSFLPLFAKLREMEQEGRANVMAEAKQAWKRVSLEKGFFSNDKGFVVTGLKGQIVAVRRKP